MSTYQIKCAALAYLYDGRNIARIGEFALKCNLGRPHSIASRVSTSCIASPPSQLLICFRLCKQFDFNTSMHLNERRAYEVCFHPNSVWLHVRK